LERFYGIYKKIETKKYKYYTTKEMPVYKCNFCDFSTEIKTHYQRHLGTKKHQQYEEICQRPPDPPTEIERLRKQNKWLCEKNKELVERIKFLEKR